MRKVIAAILLLCGPIAADAQFAAQWYFQDFTQTPQAVKAVYITPLWNITVFNTTNNIVGQRQSKQTDSRGSLIVSNMIYGGYRVEFIGITRTNVFTNCFDVDIAPGSLVNAAGKICVGTNSTDTSGFAYTKAQANARFMTNAAPSVTDYVLTATDSNGHYSWQPGGGSSGGITLGQGTNIVDGSSGVIGTNGAHTTFKFSTGGTNAVSNIVSSVGNSLFDALHAALNATNGIGISSGLSAFRGTNTFAKTNVATTADVGLVKVDNSSITVTSDGTISATTGGSGTVTSIDIAESGHTSSGAVTSSGTVTLTRTSTEDFVNKGVTNLAFLTMGVWRGYTNPANGSLNFSNLTGGNVSLTLLTNNTLIFNGQAVTNLQGSNVVGVVSWAGALNAGQFLILNASLEPTNTLNGYTLTNLNTFDAPTNAFSGNTFLLGTNSVITTASAVNISAVGNIPATGIERYGQLTIIATADVTFTNPAPCFTSDMVDTRTVTNGNTAVIAVDVIAGVITNLAITQFK